MVLKFYASVAKVLKLKVRKLRGLILMFVEVSGEKLVGKGKGGGGVFTSPILNKNNDVIKQI